jgi:toxin ParE1/3/4
VVEIRYSQLATNDLSEIARYTLGEWGVEQTVRYMDQLEACCAKLVQMPYMGKACEEIRPGLRRMECGSHVVFYRQDELGILVSRILHKSMLPQKHSIE